jgi:hypothetical protein
MLEVSMLLSSYKTHAGGMEMFSVAYANGSTARQVLCGANCDACKVCLTSEVMLQTVAAYILMITVIQNILSPM